MTALLHTSAAPDTPHPAHPTRPAQGRPLLARRVLVPLGALAATLLMLGGETLQGQHLQLFHLVNGWGPLAPRSWSMLSVLGLGLSALLVMLLLLRPADRADARLLAALLACFPIGGALTHGIKQLAQVARPAAALGLEQLYVIGTPLLSKALPSGHAVTAFTVATLLSLDRRLPWPVRHLAWALAALVALSRVAVGAHWPADLCAGAALGIVVGHLGWRASTAPGLADALVSARGQLAQGLSLAGGAMVLALLTTGYPLAWPVQALLGAAGVLVGLRRAGAVAWTLRAPCPLRPVPSLEGRPLPQHPGAASAPTAGTVAIAAIGTARPTTGCTSA